MQFTLPMTQHSQDPYPYSREKIGEIGRMLCDLIRSRDPDKLSQAVEREARKLFMRLFDAAVIAEREASAPSGPHPIDVLPKIKEKADELLSAIKDLPLTAWVWMAFDNRKAPAIHNRLQKDLSAYAATIESTLKTSPAKRRGRAENVLLAIVVPIFTRVFEQASGQSLAELETLPVLKKRQLKSLYYKFLIMCMWRDNIYQSKESLKKYADRHF